jgi:hypothetical protein
MYTCPIPNGFRDRTISLYSSKIFHKKELLHTVSKAGIYCSSDKIPQSTTMHFAARVRTWRVIFIGCILLCVPDICRKYVYVNTRTTNIRVLMFYNSTFIPATRFGGTRPSSGSNI